MKALLWSGLLIFIVSCSVKHQREGGTSSSVSGEVSLIQDAKTIEELRQNIPIEKRIENDELKELLKLMGKVDERPHQIRRKFDRIIRQRRKAHRKKIKRAREAYTKTEKAKKEAFKKKQKQEKEAFKKNKTTREQNKEFYTAQDKERREFYNDLRSKSSDFKSELRAMSRDYESDIRERRREFNEALRAYKKRYSNYLKEKKKRLQQGPQGYSSSMSAPVQRPLTQEELNEIKIFEKMKAIPSQRLTTEDK